MRARLVCPGCEGTGEVEDFDGRTEPRTAWAVLASVRPCPACHGIGSAVGHGHGSGYGSVVELIGLDGGGADLGGLDLDALAALIAGRLR
jgi:RecJ-like exonuclease